jgi:hypothetical protein
MTEPLVISATDERLKGPNGKINITCGGRFWTVAIDNYSSKWVVTDYRTYMTTPLEEGDLVVSDNMIKLSASDSVLFQRNVGKIVMNFF